MAAIMFSAAASFVFAIDEAMSGTSTPFSASNIVLSEKLEVYGVFDPPAGKGTTYTSVPFGAEAEIAAKLPFVPYTTSEKESIPGAIDPKSSGVAVVVAEFMRPK